MLNTGGGGSAFNSLMHPAVDEFVAELSSADKLLLKITPEMDKHARACAALRGSPELRAACVAAGRPTDLRYHAPAAVAALGKRARELNSIKAAAAAAAAPGGEDAARIASVKDRPADERMLSGSVEAGATLAARAAQFRSVPLPLARSLVRDHSRSLVVCRARRLARSLSRSRSLVLSPSPTLARRRLARSPVCSGSTRRSACVAVLAEEAGGDKATAAQHALMNSARKRGATPSGGV